MTARGTWSPPIRPITSSCATAMSTTTGSRRMGTHFDSLAGMEQVLATGVDEGMRMVLSQIDALLADVSA